MGGVLHLTRRFVGSLSPAPPPPADEAWARSWLGDGEVALWNRLSNPDRRHAVGVAREVLRRWPDQIRADGRVADEPDRPVMAAALLHDVGKVESSLGTPGRVVATVVWAAVPDAWADRWLGRNRPRSLVALASYRRHPELGSELLRSHGADPLTCDWAGQHHKPESGWTVPADIGRLLKECDDD